jgi:hypothetical protein
MSAVSAIASERLQFKIVAYCLIGGAALGYLKEFVFTSPPKVPPVAQLQCFHSNSTAYRPGNMTLTAARLRLQRDNPQLLDNAANAARMTRVRSAEAKCTLTSCPRAERDEYGKAIRDYLGDHFSVIQGLDKLGGLEAARWAALRLRAPDDVTLLNGLNQRLQAGLVSTQSPRHIGATYEVVLRGKIEQLVPCERVTG